MLLIIYTSSAIFVYPLLKSFDRKNRICKQFSLKLLVRKFLLLENVQRFSRDLLSNHKEERKSAEILSSSTIIIPQSCFLDIFNFNHRRRNLVQMPIISGDKWLQLSVAQWWQLEAVKYYCKELSFIYVVQTYANDITYLLLNLA